jgi:hypothetical protein
MNNRMNEPTNKPMNKPRPPSVLGLFGTLLIIGGLTCGTAAASDTGKPAHSDGFASLLAAHDQKNLRTGGTEQLPQASPGANPLAKLRTPTMVNAPMWSVVRAFYGPDGELMWGCTIEHRPLTERPGGRIPN